MVTMTHLVALSPSASKAGRSSWTSGQNSDLNVDSFRSLKRVKWGSNVMLALLADQKSPAGLEAPKGIFNFRFGQVTLRLKVAVLTPVSWRKTNDKDTDKSASPKNDYSGA